MSEFNEWKKTCGMNLTIVEEDACKKAWNMQQNKIDKLKSLLLLTDKSLEKFAIGFIQPIQWREFIRCFPDEDEHDFGLEPLEEKGKCPCGRVIFSITKDCKTPLCYGCVLQIRNVVVR